MSKFIHSYQSVLWFQTNLLAWAEQSGRHHLPWQSPHSPYKTWISEIMLQQTQVSRVIGFFQTFMETFPTIERLSDAAQDDVLHLWSGLGYYSRAKNIHKTAQILTSQYKNIMPKTISSLCELPGIGRSTAGAIRSLGFGLDGCILDGNVKRVIGRFFQIQGKPMSSSMEKDYWHHAQILTPGQNLKDRFYNQAIMDLGSMICKPKNPECERCPLNSQCLSFQENTQSSYPVTPSVYRKLYSPESTKKPKNYDQKYYLFIYDHQDSEQIKVLLIKRKAEGIWGNLWCPPEFDDIASIETFIGHRLSQQLEQKPLLTHEFTHLRRTINPVFLNIENLDFTQNDPFLVDKILGKQNHQGKIWYNLAAPQALGLSAPISRILEDWRQENDATCTV